MGTEIRQKRNFRALAHGGHVQGPANLWSPGLVNFVPAVAYLFCLSLPAAFSQPRTKTFLGSVSFGIDICVIPYAFICRRKTSLVRFNVILYRAGRWEDGSSRNMGTALCSSQFYFMVVFTSCFFAEENFPREICGRRVVRWMDNTGGCRKEETGRQSKRPNEA